MFTRRRNYFCYSNSFRGAFIFDDEPSILGNESLRTLWHAWSPPTADSITVSELETALHLDPSDPDIDANLGNVRLLHGSIPEAIKLYETALRLRPGDQRTIQNLEVAQQEIGINQ